MMHNLTGQIFVGEPQFHVTFVLKVITMCLQWSMCSGEQVRTIKNACAEIVNASHSVRSPLSWRSFIWADFDSEEILHQALARQSKSYPVALRETTLQLDESTGEEPRLKAATEVELKGQGHNCLNKSLENYCSFSFLLEEAVMA